MTLLALTVAASIAGSILTSVAVWLTWMFLRRGRRGLPGSPFHDAPASDFPQGDFTPFVSVLKPVCGLDDGLEENLRSFANLQGVAYEVIISIADEGDPALPLVRRVMAEAPAGRFTLVVGGGGEARNRKVQRLIAAMEVASGDLVLVSDSNVRVDPGFLADTVAILADPEVGCVTNPFTAAGARSMGARVEALHLLTFVLTGNVLASWVGATCVVGKSMMLRRDVLERIGGFEAFRNVLAEDQAIGLAVARAGLRVRLAPVLVRNVTVGRTLRGAAARQVRWNRIRFAFSPLLYCGEFLMNPAPLAAAASAGLAATESISIATAFAATSAVVLLRMLQALALGHAAGARLGAWDVAAVPLQDAVQFLGQFAPWLSREIEWRGRHARLGPGTVILDDPEPAAA